MKLKPYKGKQCRFIEESSFTSNIGYRTLKFNAADYKWITSSISILVYEDSSTDK